MARNETEDDIGLKILYEPTPESQDAAPAPSTEYKTSRTSKKASLLTTMTDSSILAIHGIGAHPDDTWCKRVDNQGPETKYINWLQDAHMLPKVVPNARIMRYGYESQWFGDGTISLKASTVAQRLLRALKRARKHDSLRPLIFIAHCFGGLVVLKAIVDAKRSDENWPGIYKSTTGMLFFGTPFRGAGGLNQTELIQAIESQYKDDQIRGSNLNILAPGNESLMDLMDLFYETRHGDNIARIACFFEQKPSNVGKLFKGPRIERFVVDETSGCLDQSQATEKFSLSRNHFDMNKFGRPEEEDFETVCEVIESMVQQAPALILARDQGCEDYGVPFRLTGLPVAGNFIERDLEMSQIENCLNNQSRKGRHIHVLHGLGGIGKTQLAIAYAQKFRERYSAILWLNGNSQDTLLQSFLSFATYAGIYSKPTALVGTVSDNQQTSEEAKAAVLRWLAREGNRERLMIFDNVDRDYSAKTEDSESYDVESFFPDADHGSILITTRLPRLGQLGTQLGLTTVNSEQASQIFVSHSGLSSDAPYLDQLLTRLMGLPLALVQAGRYIRETGTTCQCYLKLYETSWSELQADFPQLRDYPNHSIHTRWNISYEAIKRSDSSAAKLLQLWSYLDHQDLWFGLLKSSSALPRAPDWLHQVSQNKTNFLKVMRKLLDYSLVNSHQENESYSIHSVVHDWCLESISRGQAFTAELALQVVGFATPSESEPDYWVLERRLLPHANRCIQHLPNYEPSSAEDYSDALGNLATLYATQGKSADGDLLLQRALKEKEKLHGPNHLNTLKTVFRFGWLYNMQGDFFKAEDMLQRVLVGREDKLGPEHVDTPDAVRDLGNVYIEQRKFAEAEILLQRALNGFQKQLEPDDDRILNVAHGLAILYHDWGDLVEAEEMYSRVLHEKHMSTLNTIHVLATLYSDQGKFAEAEEMYQHTLNCYEIGLGTEHNDTLDVCRNLGIIYQDQGRTAEAESMLQRALNGYEKTGGPGHPSTLQTMSCLGRVYDRQGKLAEAEEMYERALKTSERAWGPDHINTIKAVDDMGVSHDASGNLAEAEKWYQRALSGYLKHYGPDDSNTLRVHENLNLLAEQSPRGNEEASKSRSLDVSPERETTSNPRRSKRLKRNEKSTSSTRMLRARR